MSNDVKLPIINNGSKFKQTDHIVVNAQEMRSNHSGSSVQADNHRSPYKLPTDDEVFYYRDREKDIHNEQKKNAKNHKIWDKKTASTQNPLKNFKNFGHPPPKKLDQGEGSKKSTGDKADSALITEAFNIVMDRKKQRDNMKHYSRNKETMTEVVSQKKEIFLVTMTTKIIKEETEKLQRLIENKKQRLESNLKKDTDEFRNFQNRMVKEAQDAKENAEVLADKKKDITEQIRYDRQQLSINKNENTNAESNALQSRQTKEFLEKIASPKWLKQKKLHILAKWEEHVMWDIQKKAKWDALIEEQKIKQGKSDSSPKEEEEVRLAVLENHFSKEEVVEREDLQYKMYFDKDKPGELIKKFAKLEEENLALINNQQENEETITEEEAKAKKSLDQKDELIAVATKRKELLTEQEKELTEKVKIMKELCNQKVKASGEISFEKIEDTINMFYKDFKKESEMRAHELGVVNKTEVKNKENILKILKAIERLLIDQLSNLTTQMQDSDKMEKIRRLRNEHGRPNKNKEDKERLLEIERKKAKEKQEKRLQELRRRKGRKDMFKFSFPDKEDEAEDNNKDEDWLIYQKYFMD